MAKSYIMVVDDNPANLSLLEEILEQQGHEVSSFPLGRLALTAANKKPPDLILLDINMPEMNGYEVCGRLKSTAELADIPVIFLSALTDVEDKVRAFGAGAADYIAKPFQSEEVNARVETHLKLHDLRRALKRQNEDLEEAVAARTSELVEANRRLAILDSSKNDFLKLISHELRTPLNGLLGIGELILDDMAPTAENNDLREGFMSSRLRILSIVDDALLLTEIEVDGDRFRSAPVYLGAVLRSAMESTAEFAADRHVTLTVASSADRDLVMGEVSLLGRAFRSLLETAVKFSDDGEAVQLRLLQVLPDTLTLIIESQGRTIPIPLVPKFFNLFSIGEASTPGGQLGLAPAVASRILSLFGASVSVTNRDPSGIRLTVSLCRPPVDLT